MYSTERKVLLGFNYKAENQIVKKIFVRNTPKYLVMSLFTWFWFKIEIYVYVFFFLWNRRHYILKF